MRHEQHMRTLAQCKVVKKNSNQSKGTHTKEEKCERGRQEVIEGQNRD